MTLSIRAAVDSDLQILAQMNKRLIEDEGHRNPMSVSELEARMRGWLEGNWHADLFSQQSTQGDSTIVGYAVYQYRKDEHVPNHQEVYLRQFFIERPYRNQGLGRLAMRRLISARFPPRCIVVVDVLVANERGISFWRTVGFQPYQMTLKAHIGSSQPRLNREHHI